MNETTIAWTDYTWGFFSGCKKVSAGCKHCYSETFSERHRGGRAFPHGFDLTVRPHKLSEPAKLLRSAGPSLIFCESMSDVGLDDDELTPQEIDRLQELHFTGMDQVRAAFFGAIDRTPEHRYQLLTKRPARLLRYFRENVLDVYAKRLLASCWIGVTIEHGRELHRLETLREFRALGARVLFVSAEPLLGDLVAGGLRLDGVDWLIAGGESGTHVGAGAKIDSLAERFLVHRPTYVDGPRARWEPRPTRIERMRALREEAKRAGCAFFFKQWGGPRPDSAGRLLDGRTYDELPDHVPGAMPPGRRERGAATAALARKLPMVPS